MTRCSLIVLSLFMTAGEAFRAIVRTTAFTNARTEASSSAIFFPRAPTVVEEVEVTPVLQQDASSLGRDKLKKDLSTAAIERYDMEAYNTGMTTIAEDIMKELEPLNPCPRPAHHQDLNARWSFVFTGVPTIGMRLITLLSTISVGFPPIDFQDVFLEVSRKQTQVKAIVAVRLLGVPVELNVYTNLQPNTTDASEGTFLIETFQKIVLAGVELPTPSSWHKSRDLEITYLDQDMMIARTDGGEPHLLLRHSPCSTDDDTCDIDHEVTEYFEEARAKYGSSLSRSLVDRAYGEGEGKFEMKNIVQLVQSILS